jgi:hypothetical protein
MMPKARTLSLRDRFEARGGHMEIESLAGSGTSLLARSRPQSTDRPAVSPKVNRANAALFAHTGKLLLAGSRAVGLTGGVDGCQP